VTAVARPPIHSTVATGHSSDQAVILVIGDLCVDLYAVGRLDGRFSQPGEHGDLTFSAALREQAGGTAYHFAVAAADNHLRPIVLGCVGDDPAGRMLRTALTAAGIEQITFLSADWPTARVVLAYDEAGCRMMLAERDSANQHLPDVAGSLAELPARMDLVWVSGVSVCDRSTSTFFAVRQILDAARTRGARIMLDLVPHEFYRHVASLDDLVSELGGLDGLVSEHASARRLLATGSPAECGDQDEMRQTAIALLESVPLAILTDHQNEGFSVYAESRRHGPMYHRDYPLHGDDQMAGLGDRLVCEVMPDLLREDAWDTA
jgi:sugar/nucleoside kinase (ribokinase family)